MGPTASTPPPCFCPQGPSFVDQVPALYAAPLGLDGVVSSSNTVWLTFFAAAADASESVVLEQMVRTAFTTLSYADVLL